MLPPRIFGILGLCFFFWGGGGCCGLRNYVLHVHELCYQELAVISKSIDYSPERNYHSWWETFCTCWNESWLLEWLQELPGRNEVWGMSSLSSCSSHLDTHSAAAKASSPYNQTDHSSCFKTSASRKKQRNEAWPFSSGELPLCTCGCLNCSINHVPSVRCCSLFSDKCFEAPK